MSKATGKSQWIWVLQNVLYYVQNPLSRLVIQKCWIFQVLTGALMYSFLVHQDYCFSCERLWPCLPFSCCLSCSIRRKLLIISVYLLCFLMKMLWSWSRLSTKWDSSSIRIKGSLILSLLGNWCFSQYFKSIGKNLCSCWMHEVKELELLKLE